MTTRTAEYERRALRLSVTGRPVWARNMPASACHWRNRDRVPTARACYRHLSYLLWREDMLDRESITTAEDEA